MSRTDRLVRAAIAASLVLTGCVPPQHADPHSSPTPSSGPVYGGAGGSHWYGGGSSSDDDDEHGGRGGFGEAGAGAGGD
jgi:hypothetical protein